MVQSVPGLRGHSGGEMVGDGVVGGMGWLESGRWDGER